MSSVLRRAVKEASRLTDPVLARHHGVTILCYHRVGGGSDSDVDLPVELFRRQMAHLAEHHRVVTLDEAVDLLGGDGDTRSSVVITFDDGTPDLAEHAVPVLVEQGLPATLYVATSFVEDQQPFPWGAPPATWAQLRDAVASGHVAIGSHTHSHWLLDRLDRATIGADLDRSIELIETRLGSRPRHFAYPKAVPGSPVAEVAVRHRFTSAALARNRVNRPGHTDLHRLWRTPVQRSDGMEIFLRKAAGGMRLEGELRALAATVKYRDATR